MNHRILATLVLALLLAACSDATAPPTPTPVSTKPAASAPDRVAKPKQAKQPGARKPAESRNVAAGSKSPLYPVLDVVDGDTIRIERNGRRETLRLIGLDTPETKDPRRPVQCFGREASDRAHRLLDGKRVRIAEDPSQDTRDKYGRLLVYVWTQEDLFYNLSTIREGYAHEYTYDVAYQYQRQFKAAEREAREKRRGFWAASACGGDTKQPAAGQQGQGAPRPTEPPEAKSGGTRRAPYESCKAVRAAGADPIRRGDPGYNPKLDGDGDGVACE